MGEGMRSEGIIRESELFQISRSSAGEITVVIPCEAIVRCGTILK
jgi:hypothetical protein